jgi:hypothetical protein
MKSEKSSAAWNRFKAATRYVTCRIALDLTRLLLDGQKLPVNSQAVGRTAHEP